MKIKVDIKIKISQILRDKIKEEKKYLKQNIQQSKD